MRVLFVVKSKEIETLGVMYLASVVKQAGHEAKIVTFDEVVPASRNYKPDIVGFSCMTGDQHKVAVMAAEIKTHKKKPIIMVGGSHVTFFPEDFEKYEFINVVAKGEWEQHMATLLDSDIKYPTIDSLPWPERSDFPGHPIRDFITSRGCPYNCSYCYNEKWAKMYPEVPRVRTRQVDDVIAEIDSVVGRHDTLFVYFQDSCFGVNIRWLREFSRKYRNKINLPYHCHMRPNQITEERVLLLTDSKCMSIRIALESASAKLRKLMNRGKIDLVEVRYAVRILKKWDVRLMIQNIIGLPTSTIEDDLETLEFNIKCRPAYGWVSIFSPYPGTELGDWCKKEGWYKGDYSEITDCFFDTSVLNFPPEHVEKLECLQKVFALCVEAEYLPKEEELAHGNFKRLVHKIMRRLGDRRLYGGVI